MVFLFFFSWCFFFNGGMPPRCNCDKIIRLYLLPLSMAELQLASLNIQGLKVPHKRSLVLHYMHKQNVKVLFLQETHFRALAPPVMPTGQYSYCFCSDPGNEGE